MASAFHPTLLQTSQQASQRSVKASQFILIASGELARALFDPAYSPTARMPAAYEIRAGGDVKNKKQSMADLKLRRLNELNSRLREDLERPRIKVSEASMS
jgi:hypothetical protein